MPNKILLYNKPWGMDENLVLNYSINDDFELTTEHKHMDQAVAVIFHMPTISPEDKILNKGMKKNGQMWVFWSMECEAHFMWQFDPEILGLFDISATYKLNSDVPQPYFIYSYYESLRRPAVPKKRLINAFISSNFDKSHRTKYLKELMSHIDLHSYGKVLNNKTLKEDVGPDTKNEIMAEYKFSIAFENAIAMDYVTEKFFQPLIVGSVPVYLGAPNIDEFAPADNCYVNADSFSSVKALADYLLELETDTERYEDYLKWKSHPFRNGFNQNFRFTEDDPLLRLCTVLKNKLNH